MHNIRTEIYKENVNKDSVQAEWDKYVAWEDRAEGCSGLSSNIRWINHVCSDFEEAEKYIEENDKGWYDQLAVKFKEYPPLKTTSALKNLIKREQDMISKISVIEGKIHYKGVKSSYIGCKKCGSKLATTYISSNFCPMCREDLRPETTLNTIIGYKKKLKEIRDLIKMEENKGKKKLEKLATIKWLVKIEYHT